MAFSSHRFPSASLLPRCCLLCKERTPLRLSSFEINYRMYGKEGELVTGTGQIKKGEKSEQRKIRLSCESANTNWEVEWP